MGDNPWIVPYLGPVYTLNGVVFTLDAAIGTEPWEATTLLTRFLDMERVHLQRPASPALFVFLILPGEGAVGVGLATGHTFLTLATPDPNVEGVVLPTLISSSHF